MKTVADIRDCIGEAQVKLEKARTVHDLLSNDCFDSREPDLCKFKYEYCLLSTLMHIMCDYLFMLEPILADAEASLSEIVKKENAA